jgi:hypothetical protein
MPKMKLAKWIFLIAGIFGLITTIPLVFAEKMMSVQQPEFYYGFVFLDICLQVVYIIISTSPIRFRPMMIPAILAKASGTIALTWLYFTDQVSLQWITIGAIDGVFAILFLIGYFSTPKGYEK